ncbi:MAG TPA: cytochrome c peroxidase [Chitinophagaceae bacterium]|nr:cytochrome c peroxidase [Chitinophagaceae bacterium]
MFTNRPKMLFITGLSALFIFIACKKDNSEVNDSTPVDPVAAALNLPATPFNYANIVQPAYLTGPNIIGQINTPANNPITDNGATLGRVLFYDKNLSINNTISCASCHKQANGFSDPVTKSAGFNGGLTGRNSMSLINAKYYPNGTFFWDQRAATLEEQVLIPVQDMVEMGMTLSQLETKLRNLAYYPPLFTKAFGDNSISSTRIAAALSQFVRSIVSFQSKYDAGRSTFPAAPAPPPNAMFPNFTAQENRGKELFLLPQNACAACHGSETFTAPQEKNNGLDMATIDRGFGAVANNTALDATFKITSLRNVELTAPYMHDGRFATLEQVVEHYNSGVRNHPNLSPQLRLPNGQPRLLNLTAQDKAALVAFLKTLTDTNVATDVKYSDPFK